LGTFNVIFYTYDCNKAQLGISAEKGQRLKKATAAA